jgi:MoxR-like ATPase
LLRRSLSQADTLEELNERVQQTSTWVNTLRAEIGRVIVGQQYLVDRLLVGLLANGHVLLEGVPGLAKTLIISTLSQLLDLSFNRIQFTPDLMPSDIIGTDILEEQRKDTAGRKFVFHRGPVFANVILADEINRTPPKTQAAMLQAMQEHQVTLDGETQRLLEPFLVMATQNPIEYEGTFPLPEAQLDRFFFKLKVSYPSVAELSRIIDLTTSNEAPIVERVANGAFWGRQALW